jgi:hypothetical protein
MKTILLALVCAAVLVASCTTSKRKNYVILLDNSKSITEELLAKYMRIIQETILPNLGAKDRLTILFIDECTLSQSEKIFYVDFAARDFSNKLDGLNHKNDSSIVRMKRFVVSMNQQLGSIVLAKRQARKNCGNYTDIVNALRESVPLLSTNSNYNSKTDKLLNSAEGEDNYDYDNCIIVFSDMINEDPEHAMDFTKLVKADDPQIGQMLKGLRAQKKIANLKGVTVFSYGATSTNQKGTHANKQIENVKRFWQQYFLDAGADLKAYGYDTEQDLLHYMKGHPN